MDGLYAGCCRQIRNRVESDKNSQHGKKDEVQRRARYPGQTKVDDSTRKEDLGQRNQRNGDRAGY